MAIYRLEHWYPITGNRLKGNHWSMDNGGISGTEARTGRLKLPLDEVELEIEDVVYDEYGTKYVLGEKFKIGPEA